jgi:hypothetical protein
MQKSRGIWGPPSLLFTGYQHIYPGIKRRGVNLNTHLLHLASHAAAQAVSLRPLIAEDRFDPRTVPVAFVVHKVKLEDVSLRVLCFCRQYGYTKAPCLLILLRRTLYNLRNWQHRWKALINAHSTLCRDYEWVQPYIHSPTCLMGQLYFLYKINLPVFLESPVVAALLPA